MAKWASVVRLFLSILMRVACLRKLLGSDRREVIMIMAVRLVGWPLEAGQSLHCNLPANLN
jgi:hypothetical protein